MTSSYMHDSYPHIDTMFKREETGGKKPPIRVEDWVNDDVAYLRTLKWTGYEKLDGTNIRVGFWGALPWHCEFGGKDAEGVADMPEDLRGLLYTTFWSPEFVELVKVQFAKAFKDMTKVTLYGEAVGARIHPGSGKYGDPHFVLFDVRIGEWWLKRPAVEDVGLGLGLSVAPPVFEGDLYRAHLRTANGMQSTFGNFTMEGLILRPQAELFNRKGERIQVKIKHQDYKDLSRRNPEAALRAGVYVPTPDGHGWEHQPEEAIADAQD